MKVRVCDLAVLREETSANNQVFLRRVNWTSTNSRVPGAGVARLLLRSPRLNRDVKVADDDELRLLGRLVKATRQSRRHHLLSESAPARVPAHLGSSAAPGHSHI
jgi:hypothetical protein